MVNEALHHWLEEHPPEAKTIVQQVIRAAAAREAARKAREVVRKGVLDGSSLSGKLAATRPTPTLTRREQYNGCSSSEQSAINSAAPAAQSYVAAALSYLQTHTASTARYTTWFGTYTSARHSTVLTHYSNLNGNTYSSYTFDCTCTDSDTYAYVYPDE